MVYYVRTFHFGGRGWQYDHYYTDDGYRISRQILGIEPIKYITNFEARFVEEGR